MTDKLLLHGNTQSNYLWEKVISVSFKSVINQIFTNRVYDTKQSHREAPVMLELWGMRRIP